MSEKRIFEKEYLFCEILWEHEPVGSGELVKLCEARLGWKKSTTYTVIKRLTERGVVVSEDAVVRSLVSREEAQEAECKELADKCFSGSVPQFLAAFVKHQRLSREEIEELQRLIDDYRG